MSRTFDTVRRSRGIRLKAGLLAGLLGLAMLPSLTSAQTLEEKQAGRGRKGTTLFNLTAGPSASANVNQFQCGLLATGPLCADPTSNPVLGGAFWPTGSPNQHMYSSGVQLMGFVPMDENCTTTSRLTSSTPTCFPWSGDTSGAIFYGFGGGAPHGTPLTGIYNSLNAEDLAAWPQAGFLPDFPEVSAFVTDTSVFADVLIGRQAASQQDTWVAYWDGDPVKTGGRTHPMGILVEQRTMAWNYPSGNEATVYMVFRLTNVTANRLFQDLNEARYFGGADRLPDSGWSYDSVWFAYDSDPDLSNAGNNYATAIMPFSMAIAYVNSFTETSYTYPSSLFHPPFYPQSPGITGMKYLKSPVNPATGREFGMTSVSQHTNGGAFRDPGSVAQTWRYVSLNADASKGDPNCNQGTPEQVKALGACYLAQTAADVRIWIASGPFTMEPGQTLTIATAMFAAATVAIPEVVPSPSLDLKPGVPTLNPGCGGEPIRTIEKLTGWVSTDPAGCPDEPGETLNQNDVNFVRGSLLGKAIVAQTIFDNKFLLGFAPEPPPFFLVPGSNKVTVVWEPSATEQNGDPFFAAAGDPTNPLFDANYRQFDVEGYRIYRLY